MMRKKMAFTRDPGRACVLFFFQGYSQNLIFKPRKKNRCDGPRRAAESTAPLGTRADSADLIRIQVVNVDIC
jgi:hypothetical protein